MKLATVVVFISFFSVYISLNAQTNDYPYRFSYSSDFSLIPAGIILKIISDKIEDRITLFNEAEICQLERAEINRLDRFSTYRWNPTADITSEIGKVALLSAPSLLLLPELIHIREQKRWQNIVHLGLMYSEVAIFSKGVVNIVQAVTKRNRPYLYNSSLSIDKRLELSLDPGAYQSFYSGHTSGAFASAVFLSKVFQDMYGKSTLSTAIWCGSLSVATMTGVSRIFAGKHYTTDVLTGAVAGSLIGYIVPHLHRKKCDVPIALFVSSRSISLSIELSKP